MHKVKIVGLISAAGLSSRMGVFKPLLDLEGKPLICRTVESLLDGGAEQVIVVTGRNSERIEDALSIYPQVKIIYNAEYAQTAMYDSVRIGLKQIDSCDAILFLPADVPAVRPETIRLLIEEWISRKTDVLYPLYQDKHWHPPVIAGHLLPALINYNGEYGLRGALESLCVSVAEKQVYDRACTMDADYIEDYQALCQYWPIRDIPDDYICEMLYKIAGTPEPVQNHCRTVAEKALALADAVEKRGIKIHRELLYRAALLHDVCRTEKKHAEAGAKFLIQHGFYRIGELIMIHMDWPEERPVQIDEAAILYLADKLVSGNQDMTLEQRFLQKTEQYADQPETVENIRRRYRTAFAIQEMIDEVCRK